MPDLLHFTTQTPDETFALGKCLSAFVFPSLVIALSGDLGAGKTVLTRGIVEGLGFTHVRSPSFTLVNEYPTIPPVAHVDLYRLGSAEADELGLEEYVEKGHLLIIEWGERLPRLPGTDLLTLNVAYRDLDLLADQLPMSPERLIREITVSASGQRATKALQLFLERWLKHTGRGNC